MRILIVEQDVALGLFLKKGFTVEGHTVTWTSESAEVLGMADTQAPELIVMDVSSESGMDLLKTVHLMHARAAVLTLVSQNTVEDRVRCLDMGADDCMAKPFSFHELTARCRALMRRQERSGEIVLTHGSLRLNRITRATSVSGRPVTLTTKEFRLIEFLLQNSGRCCSRGELLSEVFQLPSDNATNVVDVYINYLRKKLCGLDDAPRIVTVRGAGYRLARAEDLSIKALPAVMRDLHASA